MQGERARRGLVMRDDRRGVWGCAVGRTAFGGLSGGRQLGVSVRGAGVAAGLPYDSSLGPGGEEGGDCGVTWCPRSGSAWLGVAARGWLGTAGVVARLGAASGSVGAMPLMV